MIRLDLKYLKQLQAVTNYKDLVPFLQRAIELEHTIMLPYMTAMYSFKEGTMQYAYKILHTVMKEEMLHMTVLANIINAFGEKPDINKKRYMEKGYPCGLPLGIERGMKVGLEKYTLETTQNMFMEIEMPLHAENFSTQEIEGVPPYFTQSEFYRVLREKIDQLAPETMPGDPARQVVNEKYYPATELFAIKTRDDACRAIKIVNEQGEGATATPYDNNQGELAHYYQFAQLVNQKALVQDSSTKLGYSYTGTDYPYQAENVYNLYPNTKISMVEKGTNEWEMLNQFNDMYGSLLDQLQRTFNGAPDNLVSTVTLMKQMKPLAYQITSTPFPGKDGYYLGLPFEYNE